MMEVKKENTYFHVTPMQNLSSILQQGLIPTIGERSGLCGETEEAIYLFPSREEMDNALLNWLGCAFEEEEELCILQLKLPDTFPVIRERDSNGDLFFESYTLCKIPSEYIRAIYNESMEELNRDDFEQEERA